MLLDSESYPVPNLFITLICRHCINLCPLPPLDLIKEKLVVDEGLLAVVKLPAEHDEFAVLCKCVKHCLLDLEHGFCRRIETSRTLLQYWAFTQS